MRKVPTQARAKLRVERILDATETLIIEGGVANLAVNDIAARADIPIGSLYQYFSNINEVVRALCDRHYNTLEASAEDCFQDVHSLSEFVQNVRRAMQICWDYTRNNPGYRQLFFDAQAWEVMREADWQDTFINAQRMTEVLQPLVPNVPGKTLLALCVIIGDCASNTARLAARFEPIQEELFKEFNELVESRVYNLMRDDAALAQSLTQKSTQNRSSGPRAIRKHL